MQLLLILGIVFALGAVGFALQNDVPVTVMLSNWRFDSSLAVVLLVALGLGVLIAVLVSTPRVIEGSWTKARLRRQIANMETDRVSLERRLSVLELEVARLSAEVTPEMTQPGHSLGAKPIPPTGDRNMSMDSVNPVRIMQQARRS
jgi:lipopolysaccharide assembly protein A